MKPETFASLVSAILYEKRCAIKFCLVYKAESRVCNYTLM